MKGKKLKLSNRFVIINHLYCSEEIFQTSNFAQFNLNEFMIEQLNLPEPKTEQYVSNFAKVEIKFHSEIREETGKNLHLISM